MLLLLHLGHGAMIGRLTGFAGDWDIGGEKPKISESARSLSNGDVFRVSKFALEMKLF